MDTNVLMFAVGPTPNEALYRQLRQRDNRWISPVLWRSEMRNALAEYIRIDGMLVEDAIHAVQLARGLLELEIVPDSEAIFQLVRTSTCTAYDLEFISVAMDQGVQLITMDKQVLREFPAIAIRPADFVA